MRLLLLFFLVLSPVASQPTAETEDEALIFPAAARELEDWRHARLARTQAHAPDTLQAFHSDGCSGGLSDGWQWLAQRLAGFAEKFGERPPYEHCCIAHDRAYWRGESADGYAQRLQADIALQVCVAEHGRLHSAEYAERFGIPAPVIEKNFLLTAALMFRAVRVGGMPCTRLPWRWGYGWPECAESAHSE